MRVTNKHVTLCKTAVFDAIDEKGLTRKDVADMLGVGRDYIVNIFTPSRKGDIAYTSALAIASILDKDLEELVVKEPETEEVVSEPEIDLSPVINRLENIEVELADLHKTLKSIGSIEMDLLNTIKEVWGCK